MTREKNTADQANICTTYLKQTSERRDHFHHHSQCNEVQHIVQLELDRALVKKVNQLKVHIADVLNVA